MDMAETWFDKLKRAVSDQFERTFSSAHMSAGVCSSYSLTQVRDLLKHGASISKRAKTAGAFVKYSGVLGSGGDKLAEAAGKIDGLVKKGSTAVGNANAACEISNAVSVLNRWTVDSKAVSREEAAQAFDHLFGGTATFFERLPPPVNQFSKILSTIAEFNFFGQMQDLMHPENSNAHGRAMRQAMGVDN